MSSDLLMFVVEGVTVDGKVFRPSDWIERLIDTGSSYGSDRRTRAGSYSGPDRRRQQVRLPGGVDGERLWELDDGQQERDEV